MDFKLIRSERKSLRLEVTADGRVLVRAPRLTPLGDVKAFVAKNEAWIIERQELAKRKLSGCELVPFTKAELAGYGAELRVYINMNISRLEQRVQVCAPRVNIRPMVSRWGSCVGKRSLSFNALLALAPAAVRDGVILHELCHLKHMNHSKAFYAELLRCCPDYRESEKWLKNEGVRLIARLRLGVDG